VCAHLPSPLSRTQKNAQEVYLDVNTLEARLQAAGRRMVAQRAAAQQQAGGGVVPGLPPQPGSMGGLNGGGGDLGGGGLPAVQFGAPPGPAPVHAAPGPAAPSFMSNGAPVLLRGPAARGGVADTGGGGWGMMVSVLGLCERTGRRPGGSTT